MSNNNSNQQPKTNQVKLDAISQNAAKKLEPEAFRKSVQDDVQLFRKHLR